MIINKYLIDNYHLVDYYKVWVVPVGTRYSLLLEKPTKGANV